MDNPFLMSVLNGAADFNKKIKPRGGEDCVYGGRGRDRVNARGGGTDQIRCGRGRDVAFVDGKDSTKSCERVRRGRRR